MLVPLGGHLARLVSCNVLRKVGFEIEARSEMIGKATLAPSACSLSPQPLQNRHSRTTHGNHERMVRSLHLSYHVAGTCQIKFVLPCGSVTMPSDP